MKEASVVNRVVAFLASLRLAVVVMVTLGTICAIATFYEMRFGTPAVQRTSTRRGASPCCSGRWG